MAAGRLYCTFQSISWKSRLNSYLPLSILSALSLSATLLAACSQDDGGANEIVLQSLVRYEGGEIFRRSKPAVWRLKIPDEFSTQRNPYGNQKPYTPWAEWKRGWFGYESNPQNNETVVIFSLLSSESKVVPYRASVKGNVAFGITVRNTLVRTSVAGSDYCAKENELRSTAAKGKSLLPARCIDRHKNCSIHLNYHGWPVKLSVQKDGIYRDAARACQILRSTIDAWTISVDDLRQP